MEMPFCSSFTFQTSYVTNSEELAFHVSGGIDATVKMIYFCTSQCPPTTGDTTQRGYLLFGTMRQEDVSVLHIHFGDEVFF